MLVFGFSARSRTLSYLDPSEKKTKLKKKNLESPKKNKKKIKRTNLADRGSAGVTWWWEYGCGKTRLHSFRITRNDTNRLSKTHEHFSMTVTSDQEISEWIWDGLSRVVTPAYFVRLLLRADDHSRQCFQRTKPVCFLHMFQTLRYKAGILKNPGDVRRFFEGELVREGFVPMIKDGMVCNEYFGFLDADASWQEWVCPSVTSMRMYWDLMFQGFPQRIRTELDEICQGLLGLLPTVRRHTCETCGWHLPSSGMFSETACISCHYHAKRLSSDRGNTYIEYKTKLPCWFSFTLSVPELL